MIINTHTAPFNNLPTAPARPGKLLAETRATEGAKKAQLTLTGEPPAVSKENFTAVNSQIQDVNVAEESTEYARQSILGQPAMAMLAQANSMPQSALRLLQQ
jgi:flagellin